MELQEAIKIAEEIRAVAAAMDKIKQAVAMDVLIAHAKQPVHVTDKMVEDAYNKYHDTGKDYWNYPNENTLSRIKIKAALQAALGVK